MRRRSGNARLKLSQAPALLKVNMDATVQDWTALFFLKCLYSIIILRKKENSFNKLIYAIKILIKKYFVVQHYSQNIFNIELFPNYGNGGWQGIDIWLPNPEKQAYNQILTIYVLVLSYNMYHSNPTSHTCVCPGLSACVCKHVSYYEWWSTCKIPFTVHVCQIRGCAYACVTRVNTYIHI